VTDGVAGVFIVGVASLGNDEGAATVAIGVAVGIAPEPDGVGTAMLETDPVVTLRGCPAVNPTANNTSATTTIVPAIQRGRFRRVFPDRRCFEE
jgi:hypothetical protein